MCQVSFRAIFVCKYGSTKGPGPNVGPSEGPNMGPNEGPNMGLSRAQIWARAGPGPAKKKKIGFLHFFAKIRPPPGGPSLGFGMPS